MQRIISSYFGKLVLSLTGIALIISAIGLFIIAIYPFNVININLPVEIITPVVEQGECVFTKLTYYKHTDVPSIIMAQVVTSEGYIVTSQMLASNLPIGEQTVVLGFQLPRFINIDNCNGFITAKFKVTIIYSLFGIRDVLITFDTNEFKIKRMRN